VKKRRQLATDARRGIPSIVSLTPTFTRSQQRLRAFVEIIDGELRVYPIAETDDDERRILDALRFIVEDA
jgi:hypothetical protein